MRALACLWLLMLPASHGLVPASSQRRGLQRPTRAAQARPVCMADRKTGRRVGGRVDEPAPPAPPSPPPPAPLIAPPEPETEIPAGAVVTLAAVGVLASLLAARNLLGGSSDFYYYSSSYEESVVVRGDGKGEPKVETRRQESVRTNIPQRERAGIPESPSPIFPLDR